MVAAAATLSADRGPMGSSRASFLDLRAARDSLLRFERVQLHFGDKHIIKDATFSVAKNERLGLVGPNGAGKTSHLKMILGEVQPVAGRIELQPPDANIICLKQDFVDSLDQNRTLIEELKSVFSGYYNALSRQRDLTAKIAAFDGASDQAGLITLLDEMRELGEIIESFDGAKVESSIKKVGSLMGFAASDGYNKVGIFSGGWKMRIGLAKIFLTNPDILLLDEPTNHLDVNSVLWLEKFLTTQSIPMIIVSHDREFLNQVCTKIVEIEDGVDIVYHGNYSRYIVQRKERLRVWRDKYESQLKHIAQEEKFIKAGKSSPNPDIVQQAKNKERKLEKLRESEDWVKPPPKAVSFRFLFPPPPRCTAAHLIEVEDLVHGYMSGVLSDPTRGTEGSDTHLLFDNISFAVNRGDRIGLVGPNGVGKTTLMRIMAGMELPSTHGHVELGSANVKIGYYQQGVADSLDSDSSIFDAVVECMEHQTHECLVEARQLLAHFRFKGAEVDKKIRDLSGGEKARVALCRMMMSPANLLLLDEPTNHLDVDSKEVLEEALARFSGTIVLISHDRFFMSRIAQKILAIENKKVVVHEHDYRTYLQATMDESTLHSIADARFSGLGDRYFLGNAPPPRPDAAGTEGAERTKRFGGAGRSGNTNKGVKNANRFVR
jgi:ATPase subunit of ABC transporter with duplicated ATPase domains